MKKSTIVLYFRVQKGDLDLKKVRFQMPVAVHLLLVKDGKIEMGSINETGYYKFFRARNKTKV